MQNVIPYYPSYALLDSIVSYGKYDTLNLYLDLKGISRNLYMEHTRINITEYTKVSGMIDSSFFVSLLDFFIFHKTYALKRNIKINFYVFYELGESFYHLKVNKEYKANRKIDNLSGLDKEGKEIFTKVLQKNLELIFKVFNHVPNIKVFLMNNLEADFIPYYLIRNSLVPMENAGHLVYSNDHDLFQNIILGKNVFQFLKNKTKQIIKHGDICKKYLKITDDIPDEYYPLILSILGDKGDNILDKVKGVGPKTVHKSIQKLIDIIGGLDILYQKIENGQSLFDHVSLNEIDDKIIYSIIESENEKSTISNNMKLMSFEILSRALDNPNDTSMLEKRKYIENIINTNNISNAESIYKALNKIGILTEGENPLGILYMNKNINDYEF